MPRSLWCVLILGAVGCAANTPPPAAQGPATGSEAATKEAVATPVPKSRLPERVFVKPVFLIPTDAAAPSEEYARLFMRHLEWTQRRYREMLLDRDTFTLADGALPLLLRGKQTVEYYKNSPAQGAQDAVLELLEHDHVDR